MKFGQEYIARPILDDLGKGVTGHEHMSDLIRCKDCKYAKMTIGGDEAKYCRKIIEELEYTDSVYLDKDFFCAWAERKEE